jgi:hypothetical protein
MLGELKTPVNNYDTNTQCIGSNPSKGKAIPILNVIKPYAMKAYGEFRFSSTILDLGTRGWVVSCMPLPPYPVDRRMGVPQSWSKHYGEENKNLVAARNQALVVQPVA